MTAGAVRLLSLLDRILTLFEQATVATLLFVSVGALVGDVLLRLFAGVSWSWAAELTRFAIVWMVLIGGAMGARTGAHITIDLVSEMLPPTLATYLLKTTAMICAIGSAALAWYGWELVHQMLKFNQMSASMNLPMWAVYLAIPLGFSLMVVRFLQHFFTISIERRRLSVETLA